MNHYENIQAALANDGTMEVGKTSLARFAGRLGTSYGRASNGIDTKNYRLCATAHVGPQVLAHPAAHVDAVRSQI